MRVWRLALSQFSELDGEGARIYGGRWNSPGIPVVYAATHLSLALLEHLVHLNPDRVPAALRAFAIVMPDDAAVEVSTANGSDADTARRVGDEWARSLRTAALIVPSVLVPAILEPGGVPTNERGVILNPRHGAASAWQITETAFRVDTRLRRRG